MCIQPAFKFIHKTTLAKPRIALDDEDSNSLLGSCLLQSILHQGQFSIAADHACGDAFDAASAHAKCTWTNALHGIGLQRFAFSFYSDKVLFLYIENAAHHLI